MGAPFWGNDFGGAVSAAPGFALLAWLLLGHELRWRTVWVLVGVLVAIGNGLILALHTMLRRWSGRPPQFPVGADGNPFDGMPASNDLLLGGRYALSRIIRLSL